MTETISRGNVISMTTARQTTLSETQLVDEYGSSVYKFCRSITNTKENADDLFQDTFLQAFSQMQKIERSEDPKCFLLSTASYLWKSRRRKYARRSKLIPESELSDETDISTASMSMEDELITKDEQRMIRSLVDDLPEKYKIPIVLYYTGELRVLEIAKILNLPTGTIKSRLHKARRIIEKGMVYEYGYK